MRQLSLSTAPEWEIRSARVDSEAEVSRLYEVCLRTGAGGEDATSVFRDPRLLGDVFVGPYLRFQPDLAWVLARPNQPVSGYVLGAADTARFETALDDIWWPRLRAARTQRPAPGPEDHGQTWADTRVWQLVEHPPHTPPGLATEYPAHLHIDLLPEAQGNGNGKRLITTLFDALRDRSVPGVHLGVGAANTGAIGFYEHLGFQLVADEGDSVWLGLHLMS